MPCSCCGSINHNIRTCPHMLERKTFNRKAKKRCQCCGRYGQIIHQHHCKGRNHNGDETAMDLCSDCHLECAHQGFWGNIGIKPQVCRIYEKISFWRA